MEPTKISVVTVCFNAEKTIRRTFESILKQDHAGVEYIVIDGCSGDDTVNLIQAYAARFESQQIAFRWISEPDEGIYDAINKGIELSTGDIIGILNSDDAYEADAFSAVAAAFEQNPAAGICYGFLRVMHDNRELVVYRYNYDYYLANLSAGVLSASQHPTCFVKRSVYEKIGTFDTQFSTAADHDFLIRAKLAGIPFLPLDRVLTNFTRGGASDTLSEYERFEQRSKIFFKNGLITQKQYRKDMNHLKYRRYKELKSKLAKLIFRD